MKKTYKFLSKVGSIPKNAIRELFSEHESTQRRLKRKLIVEVPTVKKKTIKNK